MPITLTQHTALITGASRGIGRGIALKLAEQGVKKIAINYKENDAAAEQAARLLKERGAAPLLIKADIGKVADIQRMFETVKSQFGGLDIFVSNARATIATGAIQASTLFSQLMTTLPLGAAPPVRRFPPAPNPVERPVVGFARGEGSSWAVARQRIPV